MGNERGTNIDINYGPFLLFLMAVVWMFRDEISLLLRSLAK